MSVLAGVRKLSDAAGAVCAELSINSNNNNGAFLLSAPFTASASYSFSVKGSTIAQAASYTNSAVAAPVSNVLTGTTDIATDTVLIRVNGLQAGSSTGDLGTGNFSNNPLYIGRRNNATLPFNGQLYSMIIVGKAVQAGELTSAEKYVNSKTKAY
jgi:hypothetical protein